MVRAILSSFLLLLAPSVGAQPAHDELKAAFPTLLKVLTYDVNFDTRGYGDFTILVVCDPGQAEKRDRLLEVIKELGALKMKTRQVKFATLEFKDEATTQSEIDKTKAQAVLVVPGTSAATVKHLSEVVQDNQIYAIALESGPVEQSIPVGVEMQSGKPLVLINEKAARGVGARFETSILKLAKVIQ